MELAGGYYTVLYNGIFGLRLYNLQICGFLIVAAFLIAFLILKALK